MPMNALLSSILSLPEIHTLCSRMASRPSPSAVWGLSAVHKAHLISALAVQQQRPAVIITPDEGTARALMEDIAVLTGTPAALLPAREPVYYDVETGSGAADGARIAGLYHLQLGQGITLIPAEALAMRTLPREVLCRAALTLRPGDRLPPEELCRRLADMGYAPTALCEGPGQFARRGGIVDLFSPGAELPFRIEYFDTEIDSIAPFSVDSQRREQAVEQALILPATEFLPELAPGGRRAAAERLSGLAAAEERRKKPSEKLISTLRRDAEALTAGTRLTATDRLLGLLWEPFTCAVDFIPAQAAVFIDDIRRCSERLELLSRRHAEDVTQLAEYGLVCAAQTELYAGSALLWNALERHAPILLDTLSASGYPIRPAASYSLMAKALPSYGGSLESARQDFAAYTAAGFALLFLATTAARAERIARSLEEDGLPVRLDLTLSEPPSAGRVTVSVGALSAGMEYPALRLAVITEGQIAARSRRKPRRQASGGPRLRSFTDLSVGDLVVHDAYGIGCFAGIEKICVDGAERDFVRIRYAGTDSLFLPATQLDQLAKYVGAAEDSAVRLNKLGGAEWHRTKSRAKGAAKEMAKELIALYAERQRRPGFAFPPDSDWQREFEEAFEYEETADQLRTASEIKRDMEQPHPMDRLLCGDVGFGKTEVAFRAIMKCILSGKQAAILVPTTVLARQHYQTALHRFRGYPVQLGCLSRFTPPAAARELLRGAANGSVDLIVGTHKLLQKDVRFKDLGLLVVDEEQRFGVSHKEKLKELTRSVDVLTLSATPIPRTLNMALSGIRDLSVLEEAPIGRFPVQTHVMEYRSDVVADAIRRELARGGQVYYLHNRIDSIHQTAARLQRLVPEARIGVGHGRMSQEELEEVMQAVAQGEVDLFVCTTIIESGVDIPNVNTLIVEDAERYGLAQLHQIRGRVGRSTRRAWAYLTYRPGRMLTEVAVKRLTAIREFAEFGAGMKIAMRDLEIRGAGNLLGAEQSGHMMSVGYDMYLKLLEEAVLEERGGAAPVRTECTADLSVSAHIPESLVSSNGERMDLYRRIAFIRTEEHARDMTDEIIDRYGDCPAAVSALIDIALLRAEASAVGISELRQESGHLNFYFAQPDLRLLAATCGSAAFKGRLLLSAGERPYLSLRLRREDAPLGTARAFVRALASQTA